MKRFILILLALSLIFPANSSSYGLATLPASQNPIIKKKILDALEALETEKLKTRSFSQIDKTERLSELFGQERFDDKTLKEAIKVVDRVLKQKGISVSYAIRLKLVLVSRELFLSPHTKAQDLSEKFNIEKRDLITIFHLIRDVKLLQDVVTKETKYPVFVYEIKEVLALRSYLMDVFSGKVVYPLIVEWHPGERCNSNCIFCFNRGKDYKDKEKGRKPLTLEKIKALIHEFKENGVREMWFSGGKEPFTNPITPRAIKEAIDVGLDVKVYSNGILLNEAAREAILGAKQVRISINAATPETYEVVQGISRKSFERATSNLRALTQLKKERGSKVKIGTSFLITPQSHKEIIQAAQNAYDMRCDFFALRADMIGAIRKFTPEEIDEILRQVEVLKKNKEEGKYGDMKLDIRSITRKDLIDEQRFLPDMERAKECRVRAFKIGMNPYGIIFPCEYAEHPRNANQFLEIGDVTDVDFYQILEKSCKYKHDSALCEACTQHEFGMNVILEKLKDDLDYGIPLEDQPYDLNGKTILKQEKSAATEDVSFTDNLIYTHLDEDRIYELRYDISRLTTSQIEVVRDYVKFLQSKTSSSIKLRPFSSASGFKEPLISVYCYAKGFKGEGHVEVSIQEGELKDYLLRIIGILNIAFASSNIPEDLTKEDLDQYRPIMDYIKDQYKAILGVEFMLPDSLEELLKVLRYIVLDMPKSMRLTPDRIEEYNTGVRNILTAA